MNKSPEPRCLDCGGRWLTLDNEGCVRRVLSLVGCVRRLSGSSVSRKQQRTTKVLTRGLDSGYTKVTTNRS